MCLSDEQDPELQAALSAARAVRKSFPHARLRVTPAYHQELATWVAEGTDLLPEGIIVSSLSGVRVEVDADVPDPGWILEQWRR